MSETTYPIDQLTGTWTIDPMHTSVGFSVVHAMVTKVRGQFDDVTGTVEVRGENDAEVTAVIKTASVNTRQENRDEHLRSADFFDSEQFPDMTFRSTGLDVASSDEFTLDGELTIKGVTKPVSFEVETGGVHVDQTGALRAGFEASLTISRKEYGLTWNVALETGGMLVSDKVKITLDVALVKNA